MGKGKKKNKTVNSLPVKEHPFAAPDFRSLSIKLAILIQFVLLLWQFYPALSTNGDNGKYYILGIALSDFQGYRQIHLPDNPFETQYPILFPMFLGIFQYISKSPLLAKIMIAGIGVLATLMFFLYGRKYFGYILIPILFCLATSSLVLGFCVIIMSEIPYFFLTIMGFYLYHESKEKPTKRFYLFLTIIISIMPIHCRSIGLAFSAAFILTCILDRQYKFAIAHSILVIGTIILFRSLTSWDSPYTLQFFQKTSYDPEMGYVTFSEFFMRVVNNWVKYFSLIIGQAIAPLDMAMPILLQKIISIGCSLVILIGLIRAFFGPFRIIAFYVLFYCGILLVWQTQWSNTRFLVSIVPFLLLFLFMGVDMIFSLFSSFSQGTGWKSIMRTCKSPLIEKATKLKSVFIWCIACIIIVTNVNHMKMQAEVNKKLTNDWKNYYSCADWIRYNTPENALVFCRKPMLTYIRSQRKCMMYPFTHNVEKMIKLMKEKNVKYVIYDNFSWTRTTVRYVYPVISNFPNNFKIVYAKENPSTFVLEFIQ